MAQHDALTDLPNRVLLRERMEHALAVTRNGGLDLAVLMLDLDRFKEVNDTLGHPAGDSLLRAVAARLRDCITETALIARLGGDEFAVIDYVTNPAIEAAALAENSERRFANPSISAITGSRWAPASALPSLRAMATIPTCS